MTTIIDGRRVLAGMTVNSFSFLLLGIGNINVTIRMEAQGLRTGASLTEIKIKFIGRPYPGLDSEKAGCLVILVCINRPVCKYNIRFFRC